jgi:hypothetical protein
VNLPRKSVVIEIEENDCEMRSYKTKKYKEERSKNVNNGLAKQSDTD